MQSGSGWRFVEGAPKPVNKPAQPSGNKIAGITAVLPSRYSSILEFHRRYRSKAGLRAFLLYTHYRLGPNACIFIQALTFSRYA
jgi:hypothetical protein